MAQRLKYFLVVLLLMFAKENFAQDIVYERIVDGNFAGPIYQYRAKPILISTFFDKYVSTEISIEQLLERRKIIQTGNNKYITRVQPVSFCNIEDLSKDTYLIPVTSPSLYFNLHKFPSYKPVALLCVFEDRLEKQTSIPLRLRLGSLDYTNYLEQKPNAVKPSY